MDEMIYLARLFAGWEPYQQQLTKAIAPLTAEQLAYRMAPHLRSVMTLAAHIIAARVYWFHLCMGEGPDTLQPLVKWDEPDEPARTAGELVEGLEQTWALVAEGLRRWTPADLDDEFRRARPGGAPAQSFTRLWIIWHVLEHDLHHGGELSFSLGAQGLPGIEL